MSRNDTAGRVGIGAVRFGTERFGRSDVEWSMWAGQARWGNAGIARCGRCDTDRSVAERLGLARQVGYRMVRFVSVGLRMVKQVWWGLMRSVADRLGR